MRQGPAETLHGGGRARLLFLLCLGHPTGTISLFVLSPSSFFPNYFPFFLPSIFLTLIFFLSFSSSFLLFSPFFIEDHLCTASLLPSSQWAPSPHHPELQYLQCLVPQFLHLVTRFLMAAPQGMPFHHMSLEAWGGGVGGLSSWVSGDCDNLTQGAAQSLRYMPAFLIKKPLCSSSSTGLGGRLLVWSVSSGGPRRCSWPWMPSLFSAEGSSSDALIAVASAGGHLCIPLVWVAGRLTLEGVLGL